jgi:DNA polymerase-3 subunit gamma/tau
MAPAPVATVPGGPIDAAAVRRVWDEVLTTVKRKSARAHAMVREGTVSDVRGEELVLSFRHSLHAESTTAQASLVVEALHEVLGGTWRLRVEAGGAATPAGPARTQANPEPTGGARPTAAPSDDWPETARPGGTAPAPASRPAPAAKAAPARTTRPAPARGGRRDDAPPPPEPPFDPDFDRAPGFDPGDEPLDDEGPALRETSEQQAMRAVKGVFVVEPLDAGA